MDAAGSALITRNETEISDKGSGCVKVSLEHDVHIYQKNFTKEQILSLSTPESAVDFHFDVSFNTCLFVGAKNRFFFKYSAASNSPTVSLKMEGFYPDKIDLAELRYSWLPLETNSADTLIKAKLDNLRVEMEKKFGENEFMKIKHQTLIPREKFNASSAFKVCFVFYAPAPIYLHNLPGFSRATFSFSRSYFQQRKFSDVNIEVEDDISSFIFPAHRLILSERSPVFERMFEADMAEDLTRTVKIEDFAPSIVKEFLEFLYTGFCPTFDPNRLQHAKNVDNIIGLFQLGDKYDVRPLKYICEMQLKGLLNSGNIIKVHTIAYLHNSERLGLETRKFFEKHRKEVIPNTEALSDLMKEHNPGAVHDLLINKI